MTFEKWWRKFGHPAIVKRTGSPIVADQLKSIVEGSWLTSKEEKPLTEFESWWELHASEHPDRKYFQKCFELCWNAALEAVRKEFPHGCESGCCELIDRDSHLDRLFVKIS